MALEKFDLATLADMDGGRIRVAFEAALRRLEADCRDRPGVKSARKLALLVQLEPVADDGQLDSVNVTFRITDTVPKRESKAYNMAAVPGGLLFNDSSPEDVHQMSLDMAPRPRPHTPGGSSRKAPEEVSDVG